MLCQLTKQLYSYSLVSSVQPPYQHETVHLNIKLQLKRAWQHTVTLTVTSSYHKKTSTSYSNSLYTLPTRHYFTAQQLMCADTSWRFSSSIAMTILYYIGRCCAYNIQILLLASDRQLKILHHIALTDIELWQLTTRIILS